MAAIAEAAEGAEAGMQQLHFAAARTSDDLPSPSCGTPGLGAAGACIGQSKTATACACQALCGQHTDCLAWQWIATDSAKDHTTCYLKATVDMQVNGESISGACPATGGVCPPPPPPPLDHQLVGWGFTQQSTVASGVLLHLGENATELDLSGLGNSRWNITTLFQPDGAAGLLGNMSTVVREVATLSSGQTLQVPGYAVVTLEREIA
jgi:hypothetical protein